ncbi:TonB-dependent receptor [Minicystis rosea]|nr:TonB-dependent receptor [Minicystis rosea]
MRTLPRILAFAAALALAAPAAPVLAQQSPKGQQQEAATRFKKGLELFKEGDYHAALIEFRRANDLAPNFNVLYNIGQVYFQLQDYPNALGALQRYLDEGGSAVPATRRTDVQRDIDKLKARVANLEITSAVPDAEVTIDDVLVGKTPLGKPTLVSAGRHKVTVSKSGFTPTTRIIEIASGDRQTVALDPVEQQKATGPVVAPAPPVPTETPAPPTTAPTAPTPEPPPSAKPVPVAGIVVTSVLAAGAVVTGVLALGAKSSLQDEVKSPTATRDSLDSAKSKALALGVTTDVLIGSAVISAAVTLYVGLSGSSPKKDAPPPAAKLPKVNVGVGPGSVSLYGSF